MSNSKGESSRRKCVICLDAPPISDISAQCEHSACHGCAIRYFNDLLKTAHFNSSDPIVCPAYNCKHVFQDTDTVLRQLFSEEEVENWWHRAIIKTFIKNKVYCPLEGCLGLFDVEDDLTRRCTFSECYECRRGFCIACQRPWHPGQTFVRDDTKELQKTLALAKANRWTRCPGCSYFVQMKDGCNHIQCHCGRSFCYGCGRVSTTCRGECFNLGTTKQNELRNHMFVVKEASSSR